MRLTPKLPPQFSPQTSSAKDLFAAVKAYEKAGARPQEILYVAETAAKRGILTPRLLRDSIGSMIRLGRSDLASELALSPGALASFNWDCGGDEEESDTTTSSPDDGVRVAAKVAEAPSEEMKRQTSLNKRWTSGSSSTLVLEAPAQKLQQPQGAAGGVGLTDSNNNDDRANDDEEDSLAPSGVGIEVVQVVTVLCQGGLMTSAAQFASHFGLPIIRTTSEDDVTADNTAAAPPTEGLACDVTVQHNRMVPPKVLAQIYAALARGCGRLEQWDEVQHWLSSWQASGRTTGQPVEPVSIELFNKLLKEFASARHLPALFHLMDVMSDTKAVANDITFEIVANAAVRSVDFVTSAVSMDTLPAPLIPEVAFIGRSNVGKSSLVNMLCNRKALAYTSKTPGKTQQFNYFVINEASNWNPKCDFHMVDLPGLGYAKVPQAVRKNWVEFMTQYLEEREPLRVVFHLMDARLGPVAQDEEIIRLMEQISTRERFQYVIVLTKVDKKDVNEKGTLVAMASVQRALDDSFGVEAASQIPIVATSSISRLGRDQMWRYLRLAALPEDFPPGGFPSQ